MSGRGPRKVRESSALRLGDKACKCAHRSLVFAGMHVLVTKPPVKTLREHNELADLARQAGRLTLTLTLI